MSRLPVDLVAFDLTGTMVRDSGAMATALRGTLARHGVPFAEEDVRAMRGASKRAAFLALAEQRLGRSLSPESIRELAERMSESFRELLREAYAAGPMESIAGAEPTMRWLRERGVKVAATTALATEMRELVLGRLGWADGLFDCKVSSDEVSRGRPAPDMIFQAMMRAGVVDVRRVGVVGDTPLDLKSGANAGAGWVIGVLSGVYGLEAMGATPHTHLLSSVADLPRIFET